MSQINLAVTVAVSILIQTANGATPIEATDSNAQRVVAINPLQKGGIKIFYTNLGNDGMTFFEAQQFCFNNILTPAIITNAAEDAILSRFLTSLNGSDVYNTRPFWLSLNDIQTEGTFIWPWDKTNPQYRNWAPFSPAPNNTNNNCVAAQQLSYEGSTQTFGWINLPCSTKWRPLCQQKMAWKK